MSRRDEVPDIILKDIKDDYVRENFSRLQAFFQEFPLFFGQWHFFELEFTAAVTNRKVPHGLGFKPKDVLQTSKIGAGAPTFNFALFDATYLDITTTGPCTVRAFVGNYRED